MLTVICGEDNIVSRNYFLQQQEEFQAKDYQIINILPNQVEEILRWESHSLYLFKPKIVFFIENLFQNYLKRDKKNANILKKLHQIKEQIFDWEDQKSKYELDLPNFLTIKEFKPKTSVFLMLEACYPGNLDQFIKFVNQVKETTNENILFYMLVKHLRTLILIKENQPLKLKNQWQINKLKYQAKLWPKNKLVNFYDSLFKIDYFIKTSSTPFGLIKLLDIMACYYL
ncbi:MAG: hypothetical protein ACPL1D_01905 [Microgenomates group bacterium]